MKSKKDSVSKRFGSVQKRARNKPIVPALMSPSSLPGIQRQMKIGAPNDKYEVEADKVADQVVTMPENSLQMQPVEEEEEESVQMQPIEDEDEIQMQPIEEEEEVVQMKCKECEEKEKVQMSADNSPGNRVNAPTSFAQRITQSNGGGKKLPNSLNREMSHKIGADFSDVSIHSNHNSTDLSRKIGARAFTHGTNIYFNSGEFKPGTAEGKHLLAHELTHVVQQTTRSNKVPNLQRVIDGQFRVNWRNKIDSEIKDRGNAYATSIVSGISLASMPSRYDDSVSTFLNELKTNVGKYALGKVLENVPGGGLINSAVEAMITARERIEAHTIQDAYDRFKEVTRNMMLAGVDRMTDSGGDFNPALQNIILGQADQDSRFNDPPTGTEDADQYSRDMQLYIQQEVNRHMFGTTDADFSHLIADVNSFIERSFEYFILARAEVMSEYRMCMSRQMTEGSACDEGDWAWVRYPRECRHNNCRQWLTYAPMPPNWSGPRPRQEHLGMCGNQPCTWFTVSSGVQHPGGYAHVHESALERERQRFRSE